MNSFCIWLRKQFEAYGIDDQLEHDKWLKWQAFDQEQSIFDRVGDQATAFLKSDYIHFLQKVGELGGSVTNAKQNTDSIGFKSLNGTVLGALSKTRSGLRLEFSPRKTVSRYGVNIEKLQTYLQQKQHEGYPVRIDDWAEIKELDNETFEIAKQTVYLWVGSAVGEEAMGYTQEHFKFLQRFGGKLNQRHENTEQQYAYEVLTEAYKLQKSGLNPYRKKCFRMAILK